MRKVVGASLLALAMVTCADTPLMAKGPETKTEASATGAAKVPPELIAIQKGLHPQTGDVRIPEAHAVLHLGEDYYFVPAAEAKKVLVEAWGNPPEAVQGVLGMVLPKGTTIYDGSWGAVISYEATGHVSDADASSADYAEVLRGMQAGEAERNEKRKAAGYAGTRIIGWAQPPSYDAANHSLIWAKELAFDDQAVNTLNYDVRLLGRTGVLSLNMVSDMKSLDTIRVAAASFGKSVTFEQGSTYADYDASVDHTAEYGLAGLVAGGGALAVAQKVGLLAILAKFGKLIFIGAIAGIAAIGAFLRKLFGGRSEEEDAI